MDIVLHRGGSHPPVNLTAVLRRLQWMLGSLGRRPKLESDMETEMRAHLEMETEDLILRGHDPTTARRHAAAAFGGVIQAREEAIEARSLLAVADLIRSIRLATRTLSRHRAFAVTTILALGLAIAVNTTTFSVLDAMVNPQTTASDPERLRGVRFLGDSRIPVSDALGAGGRTYEAFTEWGYPTGGWGAVTERGNLAREAESSIVRANFFAVMGVVPLEGRLSPPDDRAAATNVVIISDRLRAELFPDRASASGETIVLEGRPVTVLGVVKRVAGSGMLDRDVWTFPHTTRYWFNGRILRLRAGVTPEEAQAELNFLGRRAAAAAGIPDATSHFVISPETGQFTAGRFHYALIGAAIAVLLIACTNLANLQLARGLGRSGEIAVQSALGASRGHVMVQLLTENAVMASAGLFVAVALTFAGNAAIRATVPHNIGNYVVAPQSSWRMVVFASIAAALSLLLVGVLPALRTARVDINSLLKRRAGSGAHRENARWYGTLVVVQISLAMPLITAAAMLAVGVWKSQQPGALIHQLGYDPAPLVIARVSWTPSDSGRRVPLADVANRLTSGARRIPHVLEAAVSLRSPTLHDAVTVEDGVGGLHQSDVPLWHYDIASPTYLRTLGIPIHRGTDFTLGETGEPAVVIDQVTAMVLWPQSDAIGRRIKLGSAQSDAPWLRVRGIIGSLLTDEEKEMVRQTMTTRLGQVIRVMTDADSIPRSVYGGYEATLQVRVDSQPQAVASALRRALLAEAVSASKVDLMLERLGIPRRLAVTRFIASLFAVFGVLAVGLACMGVYGIVAQAVADRRRDIAIRIALGATPRHVVRALLREHNVLVLLGVAIGLAITALTMGWIGEFLGTVGTVGLAVYGIMCLALFAAIVISALIPAMRATRLGPMEVLRAE